MKDIHRGFIIAAALLGALAVAFGAFAAHGLRVKVSEASIEIFKTGVQYQYYHVFALLAVGILFAFGNQKILRFSGIAFLVGMGLFCGSIYLFTLGQIIEVPLSKAVFAAPVGGSFFILGWLLLFWGMISRGK